MPVSPIIRYLATRAIFLLATFLIVLLIIFILPRAIPGNPVHILLAQYLQGGQVYITPEQLGSMEKKLLEEFNLDKPLYEQFIIFISNVFRGDLGKSISYYPKRVTEIIFEYIPWTLGLLIPAIIVSWIVGNTLGVLSAYKRRSIIDNALLPVFIILSGTPYYWFAMVLITIFAVRLHWLPIGGAYSPTAIPSFTPGFIFDYLYHYILPFLAIVLTSLGAWATGMRSFAIYELGSDYISYADSLGLSDRRLLSYVFRNSTIPQIVGLALSLGGILGGSLITELVFNYPGTGYALYKALTSLDYPMIQGVFLILSSTVLLSIFLLDIIYALVDPRVRKGYIGG